MHLSLRFLLKTIKVHLLDFFKELPKKAHKFILVSGYRILASTMIYKMDKLHHWQQFYQFEYQL